MRRGTALDITQRAFAELRELTDPLRDEIIATQMPAPRPPEQDPTFTGWTTDEKMTFYERGTVPERYRA